MVRDFSFFNCSFILISIYASSKINYHSGDLVGAAVVDGGWSGTTTVDVPLNGMGHIYNHKSMHVHIFPVTNG